LCFTLTPLLLLPRQSPSTNKKFLQCNPRPHQAHRRWALPLHAPKTVCAARCWSLGARVLWWMTRSATVSAGGAAVVLCWSYSRGLDREVRFGAHCGVGARCVSAEGLRRDAYPGCLLFAHGAFVLSVPTGAFGFPERFGFWDWIGWILSFFFLSHSFFLLFSILYRDDKGASRWRARCASSWRYRCAFSNGRGPCFRIKHRSCVPGSLVIPPSPPSMLTTLASDTQTTADTQPLATSHIVCLRSWNIAGAFMGPPRNSQRT
jgi:hypothetical protein